MVLLANTVVSEPLSLASRACLSGDGTGVGSLSILGFSRVSMYTHDVRDCGPVFGDGHSGLAIGGVVGVD